MIKCQLKPRMWDTSLLTNLSERIYFSFFCLNSSKMTQFSQYSEFSFDCGQPKTSNTKSNAHQICSISQITETWLTGVLFVLQKLIISNATCFTSFFSPPNPKKQDVLEGKRRAEITRCINVYTHRIKARFATPCLERESFSTGQKCTSNRFLWQRPVKGFSCFQRPMRFSKRSQNNPILSWGVSFRSPPPPPPFF